MKASVVIVSPRDCVAVARLYRKRARAAVPTPATNAAAAYPTVVLFEQTCLPDMVPRVQGSRKRANSFETKHVPAVEVPGSAEHSSIRSKQALRQAESSHVLCVPGRGTMDLDDYKCAQCREFCEDAVEEAKCGALMCEACAAGVDACPTCGASMVDDASATPNRPIRRIISKLSIPCTNDGCGEAVPVPQRKQHAADCGFAVLRCPFDRCGAAIQRRELEEHKDSCRYRPHTCGCGMKFAFHEIALHIETVCPVEPQECPACVVPVPRQALRQHASSLCPKSVAMCQFAVVGCPDMAAPIHLAAHEEICREAHGLMALDVAQRLVTVTVPELQLQVAALKRQLVGAGCLRYDPASLTVGSRLRAHSKAITALAVVDGTYAWLHGCGRQRHVITCRAVSVVGRPARIRWRGRLHVCMAALCIPKWRGVEVASHSASRSRHLHECDASMWASFDGGVRGRKLETGEHSGCLRAHPGTHALARACVSGVPGEAPRLKWLCLCAPQHVVGHEGTVWAATMLGGRTVVTASADGSVKAWDVAPLDAASAHQSSRIKSVTSITTGHTAPVVSLLCAQFEGVEGAPPTTLLVTGSEDSTARVHLVDASTGDLSTRELASVQTQDSVWALVADAVSRLICFGSGDGSIAAVTIPADPRKTPLAAPCFAGHDAGVRDLEVVADRLVSCAWDRSMTVWNIATRAALRTFSDAGCSLVARCGVYLLAATGADVSVWTPTAVEVLATTSFATAARAVEDTKVEEDEGTVATAGDASASGEVAAASGDTARKAGDSANAAPATGSVAVPGGESGEYSDDEFESAQ